MALQLNNLGNGSEIVNSLNTLDPETAVIVFIGSASTKLHHGANRSRT